jgi:23S rRNA pseudouridine955/2504/2580 synthase
VAQLRPHLELPVLHEDDSLIVVNKPAGMAVHGGSGVSFGVIEQLRLARPQARFLELVHRLDRETSGVLVIAKKRAALTALHEAWRAGRVGKFYVALVSGRWSRDAVVVEVPLHRYLTDEGERRVRPDRAGQSARTRFRPLRQGATATLLEARLDTGRTHQIRVHLAHLGTPILGDDKYGDFTLNKTLARSGLKRMFLHAARLRFAHPLTGETLDIAAPLPDDLHRFAAAMLDTADAATL